MKTTFAGPSHWARFSVSIFVDWFCRLYAAAVVAATLLLWLTGDEWWLGTVLCFGPRWVLLAPLLVVLLSLFWNWRRRLPPLIVAVVAFPFWLGFEYPWGATDPQTAVPFRVITFNTGGAKEPSREFMDWAIEQKPDVIIFEETDGDLMKVGFDPEWHWSISNGGVVLASRHKIASVATLPPERQKHRGGCLCIDLEVEGRLVRVGCLHLPTPRDGMESLVHHDRRFVEAFAEEREHRLAASRQISDFLIRENGVDVVAGDFNLPVESRIYRESWGSMTNAFSTAGFGLGHTKCTRWHGVRIDHVLVRDGGIRVTRASVGPECGSDHHPVVAELALPISSKQK